MRNYFFVAIVTLLQFLGSLLASAQSIDSTHIGPGVVYYHEQVPTGPLNFDILKIDLTQAGIHLETVKGMDRLLQLERTSSMSARYDKEGHRVIAGTNGDYWNTTNKVLLHNQISNGEIVNKEKNTSGAGLFMINGSNTPYIGRHNVLLMKGVLKIGENTPLNIDSFNIINYTSGVVLYNSYVGAQTPVPSGITQLVVSPVDGWKVNDTTECIVNSISTGGALNIVKGSAVIAANGSSASYLEQAVVGEKVKIYNYVQASPINNITQAIGGSESIIINGVKQNFTSGSAAVKHPRTVIGYTQDQRYLYIVTVDGRQNDWSVGMDLNEMGTYLKNRFNLYQAINLDGGGSTTMVVHGEVKNRFSDPTERTVCNGIFVVNTNPPGPLNKIKISPDKVYMQGGTTMQFSGSGFDQYSSSVPFPEPINWTCSSGLGVINESGLLNTLADATDGYVYAKSGSVLDSVFVEIVKITSLKSIPGIVNLRTGQSQVMIVKPYDSYGNFVELINPLYTWEVEGEIGSITGQGVFTAEKKGMGKIIVTYKNASDTVEAFVDTPVYALIDDFIGYHSYSLAGIGVNLSECSLTFDGFVSTSTPTSGKFVYSYLTGGTSSANLLCEIPVSGNPDSLLLHVYGNGMGHWLRVELYDKNNKKFTLNLTEENPGINWSDSWRTLRSAFKDAIPQFPGTVEFPVTIKKITLSEADDLKKDKGVIYLDDLQVYYGDGSTLDARELSNKNDFELFQNIPNPARGITDIEYYISKKADVEVAVYTMSGKKINTLVKGMHLPAMYRISFDTRQLKEGVYFYCLKANKQTITRKLVVVR